ncbi:hypothetical protein CSAL01_08943 [Colletotrichum salicis]|uniref:Uncharacterized protein n=1 Tax=Colletotrichum salicis TaxID=1209931 RepID=A0A135V5Z2_9PEZI|nr:hypothetical protein CSAL01_08943 [Colletotrichum salicis]
MTDDQDVASIVRTLLLRQVRPLYSLPVRIQALHISKIPNASRKTPAEDPGDASDYKQARASSPDVATEATAVHSPFEEGAGFRHDYIEALGGWMTDHSMAAQCTAQHKPWPHSHSCLASAWAGSACQSNTGPRQTVPLANHRLVFGLSQLPPLQRSHRYTCGWSTISTPSLSLTGRRGGRITTTFTHPLFATTALDPLSLETRL